MICQHQSIKAPKTGATDNCITCRADIIFTGQKWVWKWGLDSAKRAKLQRIYAIERVFDKALS